MSVATLPTVRCLSLLAALCLATPGQTANIYVTARLFGGTIIHIDGRINEGDEKNFAHIASRYSAGTIVEPDSAGGNVGAALAIADIIWGRGFDTKLSVNDRCSSACTYIWLSGRHAVIQQNSALCFHQPYDPRTNKTDAELNEYIASRLQRFGLTAMQARALVNAAVPENMRCATEWWAFQLGFQPQDVFTINAMRQCQSKFCLARP
jgi:hypothetical protein